MCYKNTSVIFDVTVVIALGRHGPYPYEIVNLTDTYRVCSDCSLTDRLFPHLSPSQDTKIATRMGVWERLTPILVDDCEGLTTSVEEVTGDEVERARGPESEVEPEGGTEWVQSRENREQVRSCFAQRSKESGFWRWSLLRVKTLWRLLKGQERTENMT